MRKFCSYVDVFQGSGEIDLPTPEGIAATWYFRKAQCGNTTPAATLPFGKMSCGAYSGGYPTGYGTHMPNSCGKPRRFTEKKMIRGIAHLSQSGTGAIGFYYNYALTSPFYEDVKNAGKLYEIKSEDGAPGYYNVKFGDFEVETTVSEQVACHRYKFASDGGKLFVDFSNDGLDRSFGKGYYGIVTDPELKKVSENEVLMSGYFQKVKLYFAVRVSGAESLSIEQGERFGAVFDIGGREAELRLAISTHGFAEAQDMLCAEGRTFDGIRDDADRIWNDKLSRIDAEFDEEKTRKIFYSNLYHSLIKPSIWRGENACGVPSRTEDRFFCIDYATHWDQYKTLLPLIFTLYKDEGEALAGGLVSLAHRFGYIPICFALKDDTNVEKRQARMLGNMVLYDAITRGIDGVSPEDVLENMKNELSMPMYADFERDGKCELAAHTLDMADACAMGAELAEKTGDAEFASRLRVLSENYENSCDFESGLLTDKSWYYEGNKWNYSFRPMRALAERIEKSGGKEKFEGLLDSFFGYGKEPAVQPTEPDCYEFIEETAPDRFEGFNNEPDMETPFAYTYVGKHDKTCEVIDAGLKYMFTDGEGGLPGNNDSGGLSSCYVWNMLGIFPLTGQDLMLVGTPHVKHAELHLASGKKFTIDVKNFGDGSIYVDKVLLCGKEVGDYRFSARRMMQGGTLEIFMR